MEVEADVGAGLRPALTVLLEGRIPTSRVLEGKTPLSRVAGEGQGMRVKERVSPTRQQVIVRSERGARALADGNQRVFAVHRRHIAGGEQPRH